MSSLNLDLDFQDYAPSGSDDISKISQQPEVQVRIPSPATTSNNSSSRQNMPTAKSVFNLMQNLANSGGGQASGLSEETIQQLIWLSNKQRNKDQRSSIAASSNWGLGYFAQYFDVTTNDVLQRILWSALPIRKTGIDLDDSELTAPLASNPDKNQIDDSGDAFSPTANPSPHIFGKKKQYSYMERFIQSRPDFYGPFWVSTTLVFLVALFSNLVSYSNYKAKVLEHGLPEDLEAWHYSVDELSMTASLVTFYVTLLPAFLWFLFWFRGCTKYYTLMETMCAYGYSLSIFIPLSAFLMVQSIIFRYLAIFLAASMSGLVLVMSFLPMVLSNQGGSSHIILIIVMVCQVGTAYILHRIMLQ